MPSSSCDEKKGNRESEDLSGTDFVFTSVRLAHFAVIPEMQDYVL